ncbi:autoinducer binding domain-containing protein [Phaeobacter gallaeciensis]|uniref:helix-turn-helix transcriptional regulator n=1 Tax=Phaeobacter gallaeciensis TaxID=60890 RepID=UPI002380ADB3|nr:autoinducer binding domain-containing protein [Phaeobacter gallaeciensis]MDE4297158.1 autoinducer binding domain-containing protein [Phaeobacter gallaeciensis]
MDTRSIKWTPRSEDISGKVSELFEETREYIEDVALSGYSLCINQSMLGYEHFESTYPVEWQSEYARRRYYVGDPVVTWAVIHSGDKRWSDILVPDMRNIMKKARTHGLVYGAVFCRSGRGKCSFLNVARDDRELTLQEMFRISDLFSNFIDILEKEPRLTQGELDVLRCLSEDMDVKGAAEYLSIAESTAKGRLANARKKYRCKTNYFLITRALTEGSKSKLGKSRN